MNNASNRMEMPAIETAPMAASPPLPVDSTKPEEPEQVLASCPFDPHIRSLAIRFSELAGVPLPLQREPVHRWENGLLQVVKNRHVLPGLDDVVEAFKQTDRTLLEPLDLRAAALAADILNERPLPPESEAVEAGECNPTRETDEARTEPEAMWVYSELRGVHAAFLSASGLTQLPTGPVERDHWNTALRELAAVVTPDNLVDLMSRARISGVQVGSPSDLLDLARDGRQP